MQKDSFIILHSPVSPEEISRLCEKLSKLECRVYIELENQRVKAKSVMGMISFQAEKGRQIQVSADGKDEAAAISLIKGLFTE